MGDASGNITVLVGGKIDLGNGAAPGCYAFCTTQIGHGGGMFTDLGFSTTRGKLQGNVDVEAGLAMTLTGGGGFMASSQIGNGGFIWSFYGAAAKQGDPLGVGASGNVTAKAKSISMVGGANQGSSVQIGNGGYFAGCDAFVCSLDSGDTGGTAIEGRQTGNVKVTTSTGKLDLVGGADTSIPGGQAIAQIGNGGFDFSGPAANIPSGSGGKQGDAGGNVQVVVGTETSLIDDASGSPWWIGHHTTGTIIPPSPVLLDTATLDFSAAPATNATINNTQFWPRFAVKNLAGGDVTLRVRGSAGNDGDVIDQQPLATSSTNRLSVLASRHFTVSASVADGSSGFIDLVADDANPISPAMGSGLFTIDALGSISGPVRVYAVSPSQFLPGAYVPPGNAFAVWHDQSGSPVVGANFKSAVADLAITKTDGVTTATPGGSVTYTIKASNAGPSNATGATVADTFPASLTCTWTCVGAGGGTCTASGSGNVNDTVNLPSGGSVTYTASCTISAAATGTLSNTATVTAPAGVTDSTPGNNSATDTDSLGPAPVVTITATKTVTGSFIPGGSITYTVVLSNTGTATQADNAGNELTDVLPASLTLVSANATTGTAVASVATNTVTWNGAITAGGSVTITIQATVGAGAITGSTVSNQAGFAFDADVNGSNESVGVSDDPSVAGGANPTVFVVAPRSIVEIPTLGGGGLVALAGLLALLGARATRRRHTGGRVGSD